MIGIRKLRRPSDNDVILQINGPRTKITIWSSIKSIKSIRRVRRGGNKRGNKRDNKQRSKSRSRRSNNN